MHWVQCRPPQAMLPSLVHPQPAADVLDHRHTPDTQRERWDSHPPLLRTRPGSVHWVWWRQTRPVGPPAQWRSCCVHHLHNCQGLTAGHCERRRVAPDTSGARCRRPPHTGHSSRCTATPPSCQLLAPGHCRKGRPAETWGDSRHSCPWGSRTNTVGVRSGFPIFLSVTIQGRMRSKSVKPIPKKKLATNTKQMGRIHSVLQRQVVFIAPWRANNVGLRIPEEIKVIGVDGWLRNLREL